MLVKRQGKKIPERNEKVRDETLRGENRRLRKEVARLRKENEKLRGIFDPKDEDETVEPTEFTTASDEKPRCLNSKCKAYVKPFELREIWYYSCEECGARGQYK